MNSLKQKLHAVERTVKDKEAELRLNSNTKLVLMAAKCSQERPITTNFLSALLLLLFLLFCVFNFNFYFYSSQLKKDIKMTNIEELQIQSETYYQEVNCDGVV